jgi:predicted nucleic acid-binding protein
MQKTVIDTNVIVSALIGSGYPAQIIFDLVFGKKLLFVLPMKSTRNTSKCCIEKDLQSIRSFLPKLKLY